MAAPDIANAESSITNAQSLRQHTHDIAQTHNTISHIAHSKQQTASSQQPGDLMRSAADRARVVEQLLFLRGSGC
eukprot:701301-Rhodomonas_salina.2